MTQGRVLDCTILCLESRVVLLMAHFDLALLLPEAQNLPEVPNC